MNGYPFGPGPTGQATPTTPTIAWEALQRAFMAKARALHPPHGSPGYWQADVYRYTCDHCHAISLARDACDLDEGGASPRDPLAFLYALGELTGLDGGWGEVLALARREIGAYARELIRVCDPSCE